MNAAPRFVTPEDFLNYWNQDLHILLKEKDNRSNKANIFLCRVEDRMMNWIDAHTFRNVRWEDIKGFQLENFQKAILTQAMYIYRNSDISMDSGYDPERGIIASIDQLESIEMSRAALEFLTTAGLNNHSIKNNFRKMTIL